MLTQHEEWFSHFLETSYLEMNSVSKSGWLQYGMEYEMEYETGLYNLTAHITGHSAPYVLAVLWDQFVTITESPTV